MLIGLPRNSADARDVIQREGAGMARTLKAAFDAGRPAMAWRMLQDRQAAGLRSDEVALASLDLAEPRVRRLRVSEGEIAAEFAAARRSQEQRRRIVESLR